MDGRIEKFLERPWGCLFSIGEVMVLVAVSKKYSFDDDEVKGCLLEEFFVREVGEVERFMGKKEQLLLQTKTNEQAEEDGERRVRRELKGRIVTTNEKKGG